MRDAPENFISMNLFEKLARSLHNQEAVASVFYNISHYYPQERTKSGPLLGVVLFCRGEGREEREEREVESG